LFECFIQEELKKQENNENEATKENNENEVLESSQGCNNQTETET